MRQRASRSVYVLGVVGSAYGFVPHSAVNSPLFTRTPRTDTAAKSNPKYRRHRNLRRLELPVLTTPEAIFEETSTQNLLDDLIDESVRTSARRPVMMQFDPSSGWIWKRWRGTVFSETWPSVLRNMCMATCVALLHSIAPNFINRTLSGFDILWGQLLSVTTFTLTFFLNQSYGLWRKCYDLSRRLQGRLNDLGMTMSAHAARTIQMRSGGSGGEEKPAGDTNGDDLSRFTPEASQILQVMARYIRIFNVLTYASFTRSHRPILTPRGMRRLVERGLITTSEREVLVNSKLPATQRHNAVLMWIIRIFQEGREAGHIEGGAGFEQQFMEKCHVIRAQYGAIGDELSGRMPLAYAHIVQVLVDVVLWMYPFMAASKSMSPFLGVLGTGLLTMFYQGLFDLAKQFLDPYDNENYGKGEDPLCVDTLIAETNSGSMRWYNGLDQLPFSAQLLQKGKMQGYVLPLRGYTVAEVEEMELRKEAERIRKEREEQAAADGEEDAERDVVYDEETIADILDEGGMAPPGTPEAIPSTPAAAELKHAMGSNDTISTTHTAPDGGMKNMTEELSATTAMEEEVGKAVWGMEDRVEACIGAPDECMEEAEAATAAAEEEEFEEYVEAASAIAAAAEAEFLETEAILKAPPNADYLPEADMEEAEEDAKKGEEKRSKKKDLDAGSETLLVAKGVMEIAEEVEAEWEESKSIRESDGMTALEALDMDEIPWQPIVEERPNGSRPEKEATTRYLDSLDKS